MGSLTLAYFLLPQLRKDLPAATLQDSLQDLMRNTLPLFGKFLLISGHASLVLPVVSGGSLPQIVDACIMSTVLFTRLKHTPFTFTKNE